MRKIINGLRYDTETATLVATYSNGIHGNDIRYVYEGLYITRKGNWFLEYDGGAISKYSVTKGNTSSGSSGIIPFTPDEAYKWLEENDASEETENHFPDRIQEA